MQTCSSATVCVWFYLLNVKFRADLHFKLEFDIISLYCGKYNGNFFSPIVCSHMLCFDCMINILLKSHHFLFHLLVDFL